jgi:hypothetical protein
MALEMALEMALNGMARMGVWNGHKLELDEILS